MSLPPAEANWLADQQASRTTHYSLHTAAAGTTGANEAAGSGYSRVAANWNAAGAAGPLGSTLQPATDGIAWGSVTFSAAAAGSYLEVGFFSASTTGTFRGSGAIGSSAYTHVSGSTPTWSVAVGPGVP
jgi:hypothetical protein